ncbi:unnamed protein product [Soboliphyme baturini]|uniref:Uncharacterized protein n=1 Tax=Soboliphyme baturini TaxID=241478 RepID=A0A183IPJ5_9BILA|nr:unnamed protein product [Soboliphyme baturini]
MHSFDGSKSSPMCPKGTEALWAWEFKRDIRSVVSGDEYRVPSTVSLSPADQRVDNFSSDSVYSMDPGTSLHRTQSGKMMPFPLDHETVLRGCR